MADIRWDVNGTTTDGLVNSHPQIIHGQSVGFRFYFTPRGDGDHISRYQTLRDLMEKAGAVATGTNSEGLPWYIEQHTGDSLLLEITPGPDSTAAKGVWGVLTGGSDETSHPQSLCRLNLTVFILANQSDYATASDVEDQFKVSRS